MAETYKIVFRKSAEKQLLKLPKPAGLKIIELIKHLSKNPIPANAQKMSGFENIYRLRSGVYRVVYSIDKGVLVIEIIKIGHRQNIYK
jgi:mRNA interferase RelE/StbE